MRHVGEKVVRIEAEALRELADRIAGPMAEAFERAIEVLHGCGGRVVVTGMGKSGIVARKVAATLSSTGTPAIFLHPAEAVHGDLGVLVRGDVVLALSASGETEEIVTLLPTIKRLGLCLIAMTGDTRTSDRVASSSSAAQPQPSRRISTLARAADVALDCSIAQEACSLGLAPTASTTTMLALGDALAMALAEKRGFKEEDFADLHPGGKLGKRLARISSVMHAGESIPKVAPSSSMSDVIYEMSRKGLGVTTVADGDKLRGIISDGDLRRLLQRRGKEILELPAAECMTKSPITIGPDEFAAAALNLMEERRITSLVVVDAQQRIVGIVHLHDLWGIQMV